MQIGALGDIHGEFGTVDELMKRHADVPLWLSVGDVASNAGEYFAPAAPLYWIKGNNEDFDFIEAARAGPPLATTLRYLPNGGPHQVGPWRVAALGGTFAPSWYHTPAAALPPSRGRKPTASSLKLGKSRDDKRRHFVRDEVVVCKGLKHVDLFMTHEAPRPFYPAGRRVDAGKTVINEALTGMRRPMFRSETRSRAHVSATDWSIGIGSSMRARVRAARRRSRTLMSVASSTPERNSPIVMTEMPRRSGSRSTRIVRPISLAMKRLVSAIPVVTQEDDLVHVPGLEVVHV